MKKANIIVKGEVQRVGYRDSVAKIARKLKITGFVENLKHFVIKRGDWHEESARIGKKMLEKQDATIDAIGEVSEKIDGSKEEIVTEISSLRDDLRSYMEYKFARIEHEVETIKAKIGIV